jgi:DNA polymerase alpha subunit B
MFSLNELVFGITTNDILFHLSREEIARSPGISNPSARLTTHLLTQRSFYPLFPPPPRDALPGAQNVAGAALDVAHVRLADLVNVTPDVLLLPGLLQPFAKVVDGVVVVNPGMAAKPRGPGTWVVMTVRPKVVEEAAEEVVAHGVWERARVEVRRI